MSTYLCPDCNAALNVAGYLILTVKKSNGNCGVVLLSEKLGDYTVHHHPDLSFEKGEHVHFRCPACKSDLTHSSDKDMVRVFLNEDGEETTVLFSAVFGENATYQVSEKRNKTYGEMVKKFQDPYWYLKIKDSPE